MSQGHPSDLRALAELSALGAQKAPLELIYRACAAAANSGVTRAEETRLTDPERALLAARRAIFSGDWNKASEILGSAAPDTALLEGDASFIRGIVAQRRGDLKTATERMNEATATFREAGLHYRMIRAHLNALIFRRDLGEYVSGEIYALEQDCVRREYFDMAASISRGRAIELAGEGEFEKALLPCESAIEHYTRDGCPEDRALCQALLAILHLLCGNREASKRARDSVQVSGGRLVGYLEIIHLLENGKTPKLEPAHPLARVPWQKSALALVRKNSQYGRIISLLREGPLEKNQLIESLWGPQAGGEAYENRLRVALATLRKKYALDVRFDGARYGIQENAPRPRA